MSIVIESVFFDCDGVLVNTEPLHYRAFLKVVKPYGALFDYKTYTDRYIGFDDRDAFRAIMFDYPVSFREEDIPKLVERKNAYILEEASLGVDTFNGVVPFVRSIHEAGVPLGLVSGSLRKEVEAFLSYLGILELFSIFITAEDVSHSKPSPESYQRALKKMAETLQRDLTPSRCIAFEDTPAGIESAKGAGIRVVAVEHSFDKSYLNQADLVIPSFEGMSFSILGQLVELIIGAQG
ncbi:MAG: HAD family phosphatase [Syntrophobacterales bacterium]|nr:HAD family phosphatase [Syntrophobacterales bacterium]